MMIPQPSQSVITFLTGIIITPTPPILQSTVPFIQQSSVLGTNTSTFIQAGSTTFKVVRSSTLSPAGEKMKKLKEDKQRWISRAPPLPESVWRGQTLG